MQRVLSRSAPAKINLYLHVTGQRADGYHLLDSYVAFAQDIADTITISENDAFSFSLSGPMAAPLSAEVTNSNLAVRAARLYCDAFGINPGFSLHLEKHLPAGAGLGGGSADAAAVIHGLEDFYAQALPDRDARLLSLGADVPVCYHGAPCRIQGVGEVITAAPPPPALHLLLVWPNAHIATPDVFKARTGDYTTGQPDYPHLFGTQQRFVDFLQSTRNDLSVAAEYVSTAVAEAREALASQNGCLLARMSGSGSTIFGVFERAADADTARARIAADNPDWWVRTSRL